MRVVNIFVFRAVSIIVNSVLAWARPDSGIFICAPGQPTKTGTKDSFSTDENENKKKVSSRDKMSATAVCLGQILIWKIIFIFFFLPFLPFRRMLLSFVTVAAAFFSALCFLGFLRFADVPQQTNRK